PAAEPAPAVPSLAGPDPATARTDRAAAVLRFAHAVAVDRTTDADGTTHGLRVGLADATASAVAARLAPGAALAPEDERAFRAYLVAASKDADPFSPSRLVAASGLLRAVDRALERT